MKKKFIAKIIGLILGIVLVISVSGNIYLLKNRSDTKEEVAIMNNQLVTANNQIADLQEQLTDLTALQTQVDDLQRQLTESREQIESLETTNAENNTTISDLEEQLAEQEQLLSEFQELAPLPVNQSATNTGTTSTSNTQTEQPSANPENTPTDHNYDNQQGNNDIPELSGDPSTWPCIPGYEYKPGTEYVYPLGWITNNGGTGVTVTGTMDSDKRPCEYDENGNCTIHEHSGY